MRATSPSGAAAFEGEVQWSSELGYGTRPAEGGQSEHRDDEATGTKALRDILEPHLLTKDIPAAHKGMQGRVWRAKLGAQKNKAKMAQKKAQRAEAKAAKKAAE